MNPKTDTSVTAGPARTFTTSQTTGTLRFRVSTMAVRVKVKTDGHYFHRSQFQQDDAHE